MCCPTLAELPPPPPGKTGWPWTEESPALPDMMPDGTPWPRVSIVTPSYNQGQFIEETIRSVLLQGYPNLEYIIMDGGSTDESVEIIRKYEPWLAKWVSEKDRGQADAINKGFARATGEIFAWLNSDDVYEPRALQTGTKYLAWFSDCEMVYGTGWFIDASGNKTRPCTWVGPFDRQLLVTKDFILQPASFWRRGVWERTGGLDLTYHWGLDWEWKIRATAGMTPHYLPIGLARWRLTPEVKSLSPDWARRAELAGISRRYGGRRQPTNVIYQVDRVAHWMEDLLGRGTLGKIPQYPLTAFRLMLKQVYSGRYL